MKPIGSSPRVGLSMPRADAMGKVTGAEKYAADFYAPDMLWCGVRRSGEAHADLVEIDVRAARELPGVLAVLTHRDVPGENRQGIVRLDQPVLVDEKVRRIGDALALVVAESRLALDKALAAIEVSLAPRPPVFDPEEALAEGSPVIHDESPDNVMAEVTVEKGEGVLGLEGCDVLVEGRFELPRQEHAYLETEAGWARLEENGRLLVVASTQSPFRDRSEIARVLGWTPDRVRVVAPYLGGGFGGKDGVHVQCLLALAALAGRGRPVRMCWDREESFLAGVKRLPARLHYRLGAARDGRLRALDCRIIMDGGAYDHLCGEVLALAVEHAGGAYRIPHVCIRGTCAYTNNPSSGPFRGFGVPQVTAALEQMVDRLAFESGLDPLSFRLMNVVRQGDANPVGVTLLQSTGAAECLARLSEHPWYKNRKVWKAEAPIFKRRGLGLVCLSHGSGYGPVVPDFANAKVELTPEGRFLIDSGVPDMGQGNASTCLQVAGEVFNQDPEGLELRLPDTDATLPSGTSAASRTTYTYANALIGAAHGLKDRILRRAADLLMADAAESCALLPGRVRHLATGREISLADLARAMSAAERTAVHHWRAPTARDTIRARLRSVYGLPHLVFSYAAHLARVEVDELTGRVDVQDYLAVTEAGRTVNPQLYEQQVQGGIVQGLGYALYEDYMVKQGRGLTPDLATYVIPTAVDVPDMDSEAVELFEPTGPYGLKGLGEIPINGPLPAVANALFDACGVRIPDPPLTPEKVLMALSQSTSGDE